MITRAPGKVVVFGEYAVLAGAPAGVMAIDAYATVRIERHDKLSVVSRGFDAQPLVQCSDQFSNQPIADLLQAILKAMGYSSYPDLFNIELDTQAFYTNGNKLGIGSSAALCVALYRAMCELLGHKAELSEAMAIHYDFQGQSGSGLDVAASWHEGFIQFRQGQAEPVAWPENLHYAIIWTQASASTKAHLASFSQWRTTADQTPLNTLCDAAEAVAKNLEIAALENYVAALQDFDRHANLGIYTQAHSQLTRLAIEHRVLYKPCGAGGGDIGMVISDDPSRLADFLAQSKYKALPFTLTE